jgi:hypothetical protein
MVVLLKETEVAGERFMTLGATLLVASKSEPGTWHRIDGATCDCKGFQYRGHCRHVAAALQLEAETLAVTVEETDRFGGGWVVRWGSAIHGGVHFDRQTAEDHADRLRHAEDWDRAAWIDRHRDGTPTPPAPIPSRAHLRLVKEAWV